MTYWLYSSGMGYLAVTSNAVANLSDAIRKHAAANASREYLVVDNKRFSYGEVDELVDRCCQLFAELGLKQGDVASGVIANGAEYVVLYMAALRYGIVFNPYPFTLSAVDLRQYLTHVQPRMVFCQSAHYNELAEDGAHALHFVRKDFFKTLPGQARPHNTFDPSGGAPACLYYSSGTIGNPKSIVFSHANMLANTRSILRGFRFGPDERHLIVLPLGHTASINYSLLPCTLAGGSLILASSFWKVRSRFWEMLREQQITYVELVPSILMALLNTPHSEVHPEQMPALRFIGCGSSTLPRDLQTRFIERFGVRVANLYGLSETGPSHVDYPLDPGWEPGSIGFPLDCNECFIVDKGDRPLPPGELGEIAIRGANVFTGYYKNNALYHTVVRDGVFFTGDLGYSDEQGRFWFAGRLKELIIKGGINIAPDEIDEVLYGLDGVASALTVGDPDDYLGEMIHSYIVLAEGTSMKEADVLAHCRAHLSRTKVPDKVSFVESIPAGPSGKFLRRAVRERIS